MQIKTEQIKDKLKNQDQNKIIKELGYKKISTGLETMQQFLASQSIYEWLKKGKFDHRYTSKSFLLALCKLLNFSKEECQESIDTAEAKLSALAQMQKTYIFIDTNFKRTSQTIISLSTMEPLRHIKIDAEEIVFKKEDEVLDMISKIVKNHYQQSDGKLDLWGDIEYYVYHDRYGDKIVFDSAGNICKDKYISESKAEIKL